MRRGEVPLEPRSLRRRVGRGAVIVGAALCAGGPGEEEIQPHHRVSAVAPGVEVVGSAHDTIQMGGRAISRHAAWLREGGVDRFIMEVDTDPSTVCAPLSSSFGNFHGFRWLPGTETSHILVLTASAGSGISRAILWDNRCRVLLDLQATIIGFKTDTDFPLAYTIDHDFDVCRVQVYSAEYGFRLAGAAIPCGYSGYALTAAAIAFRYPDKPDTAIAF